MKKLIQMFCFATLLMMGGMTVVSCDPCAGVVCIDGSCSNGTCLCNDGYRKDHNKCVAFNLAFEGTDLAATQLVVDTAANTQATQNVLYTLVPDETNPYKFTLNNFNNVANNNITFTISSTNSANIVSETVSSSIGNSYMVSGASTTSTLQLKVEAAPKTWTVQITL